MYELEYDSSLAQTYSVLDFQTECGWSQHVQWDSDHMYRVLDGPIGKRIASSIENKLGVVFLGWMYSGNRNAWNNKRPIKTPSDMKGLKEQK